MRRNYSRLARVEEGKNMRMAYAFGIGAIIIIVLLAIFGIPVATKIAGYVFDMKKSPSIVSQDTTPPGPPFIKTLPEATNNNILKIEGSSEPETTVEIFVNDEKTEVPADGNGNFETKVTLIKGSNTIYAKARDEAENESAKSRQYTVYFSKDKPKLEVARPNQGDSYYGDKQRQLSIEGATCPECSVTVNGRIGLVDDEGNFKLAYSLNDGNNDLNIITTDKSGNTEETTISVNFTP